MGLFVFLQNCKIESTIICLQLQYATYLIQVDERCLQSNMQAMIPESVAVSYIFFCIFCVKKVDSILKSILIETGMLIVEMKATHLLVVFELQIIQHELSDQKKMPNIDNIVLSVSKMKTSKVVNVKLAR
ncbi:hypothetical protein T05_4644 [Trichinella murrelli]|uniref:Uncharacterized protein n=1 Tax=Trichinella murrelli TaxID=144512 RepID=A0A0V0UGR6_9BILA|nr:hypothetical protein T05_4644 [Trichinella murrelli]